MLIVCQIYKAAEKFLKSFVRIRDCETYEIF